MASLTRWTWVWASSRSWWWTGRPDVLQSVGSQRIGHDWATELNWWLKNTSCILILLTWLHIAVVVQSLSGVQLCNPWTAAHQASLSFTISQSLLKLMSIESVMPLTVFFILSYLEYSMNLNNYEFLSIFYCIDFVSVWPLISVVLSLFQLSMAWIT